MNRLARCILINSLISLLLVGCSKQHSSQGYVEGEYRYIATHYSGTLQQLYVERGDTIKAGDPLFQLDLQPESDQLKQAENQVAAAQADQQRAMVDITLQQLNYQRQSSLYNKGVSNPDILDRAKADLDRARADFAQRIALLAAAEAALTEAQWTAQQKGIKAPVTGIVFDTYYKPGELVSADYPVVSLLAPDDVKVIFFISEQQLSQIKLGEIVEITCEKCQPVNAKINYISPEAEFTPPVIYSEETRDKLVFRIEAKPKLIDAYDLHPGQPVTVRW